MPQSYTTVRELIDKLKTLDPRLPVMSTYQCFNWKTSAEREIHPGFYRIDTREEKFPGGMSRIREEIKLLSGTDYLYRITNPDVYDPKDMLSYSPCLILGDI